MREKIKPFIINNWHYIIFTLLSAILPCIWLTGNFLMVSEEKAFINYQVLTSTSLYSWISGGYGSPATTWNHTVLMPNAFIYYILSCLGFSNYLIQKVFIGLVLLLIFFSVTYAIKIFTKNKVILMTGVLFYVFSFYSFSIYFFTAKMFQMILLPLFFAYLFQYLKTEKYKYAVYNFLALFFLQAVFCNIPQLVVTFVVYLMAILYFVLASKINFFYFLKKYFFKLASFFGLLLPIFLYHALIYYFSFITSGGGYEALKQITTFKAIGSNLSLLFQMRGSWWEYLGWQGIAYNNWVSFYDSKIIIICLYIIIAPIFISLLYRKRKREEVFFYITFIAFIVLASGSSFYPPIYNWLYEHAPFFAIFRESWGKFVPLFLINFVILLTLALEKIKIKLAVCLVLLCVVVQAYPFFSFNFLDRSNVGWKKTFIAPPQYWYEYMAWTKNNKDETILSYPVYQDGIVDLQYNWYPVNLGNAKEGALVYYYFNYAQNINLNMADMNGKYKNITKIFSDDYSNNFIKLGTIDYILYQKDLDSSQMRTLDKKQSGLKSYFQDKPFVVFGDELFLHKIKPEYYLPHIYAPNNLIRANDLASIAKIVSKPNYQMRSAIYLEDQSQYNLFKNKNDKINEIKTPTIEYKKINPAKYQVLIHGATSIFPLVFAESFNDGWKVYSAKSNDNLSGGHFYETWFRKSIDDNKNHFMVNGYANSWNIDPNDICLNNVKCARNSDGSYDFEIIIEYWPQRLFYFGLFVSGATLFGCLCYLGWDFARSRKRSIIKKIPKIKIKSKI